MNPQSGSLGGCLRFGAFELDIEAGELRKHGIRIRLQEQPFKVLLYLVQNPGVIVPRQELAAQLWGEGTFVDSEHGLSVAMARVRQVLRDSAESPRYIETIARRGYRFIAPVTNTTVSEAASLLKGSASRTRFSPTRIQFRLALGVASISRHLSGGSFDLAAKSTAFLLFGGAADEFCWGSALPLLRSRWGAGSL